ncbi:Acetamidase [Fusarium falciforme]|uniref:Acetamidase n=1 Tax=Fusarium falciforme TaxID=195108 RepID=UPI002301BCED|nr:Acetamidase [Fusarium falciforme]WAO97250.1 Acetamidase [Fusarium falciforme]
MSFNPLPIIQPIPVPLGPPKYELLRRSILEEFAAKVPPHLRVPETYIAKPPKNVTFIPRECGILSPEEIDITENYDATALASAIASKKLKAVSVATAFGKRAILAHQVTCCLTEWFMDEAIQQAKALDDYLEATGKTVGPLHGVPISIKEHIPLAGHWSCVGFLDTRTKDEEDCHMTAILRQAGAVFYCKTVQPQSLMHLESDSIYGRVLNPHNINLSAGGSTGGEAALIAMRGSVLGVGTDIGGSIRGPSGFCGIYGFKPSSYTLPMKDFIAGGFAAELNILCSTGPMANSLRDMDLFMSVVSSAQPHLKDPRLVPIPWTGLDTTMKGPLKIGIMASDGVISPQPPVTRALSWARSKLENSNQFQVKTFEPYQVETAMGNISLTYWPDGGKAVKAHLEKTGEPCYPLTKWVIREAEGRELTAEGILQQRVTRDQFRCDFAEYWESQDVDVVLCPVYVGPAAIHETSFFWNYTAFWNYVDYPGLVFPTQIKAQGKGIESYLASDITPLSDNCKFVRHLWANGDYEGAPINLQLIARKYYDSDLFAALGAIKGALELEG